jgi:glc operon protein GlcG
MEKPMAHVIEAPTLSLAGADVLAALAQDEARRRGVALCIALVDAAGHLLAFRRMDGAGLVSIEVAIGKARTAALLRAPSRLFEEKIDGGAPSVLSAPGLVPLRGGVPVRLGAGQVGAIGISGAAGEVDEAVAMAAVAAFARDHAGDKEQ